MWTRTDWRRFKDRPPAPAKQFLLLLTVLGTLSLFLEGPHLLSLFFVVLFILGSLHRPFLMRFNQWWHLLGCALAWLIQPLFLSMIYFFIFLPFGFFLLLIRKKKYAGHWVRQRPICRFDKSF